MTHEGNLVIDAAVRADTAWYSGGHVSNATSEGGDAYTITNANQDAGGPVGRRRSRRPAIWSGPGTNPSDGEPVRTWTCPACASHPT